MADFYGTVAAADAWHTAHGSAGWIGTNEQKEAALLVASEWLDERYRGSFPGYPTGKAAQVREWPRTEAVDIYGNTIPSDTVPVQIERATYVVALRQIMQPGSLYVDWTPGKDKISVAVSGAVSVTYAGAGSYADAQLQIGGLGAIMAPVLIADNTSSMLSGRSGRV